MFAREIKLLNMGRGSPGSEFNVGVDGVESIEILKRNGQELSFRVVKDIREGVKAYVGEGEICYCGSYFILVDMEKEG